MLHPALPRNLQAFSQMMVKGFEYASARRVFLLFTLIYFILSVYALSFFLYQSRLGDAYYRSTFVRMVEGTAWKPFVYRVFMPGLINTVDDITPQFIKTSVSSSINDLKFSPYYAGIKKYIVWLDRVFSVEKENYKRFIAVTTLYAFLLGYMAMLYMLGKEIHPEDRSLAMFAPIFGIFVFTSFGQGYTLYLYDIPTLFFSSALFYCIFKNHHRTYMLLFFCACLNKETTLFTFIFFTLWNYKRLDRKSFVILWALQVFMLLSIKTIITLTYINNVGSFLEDNYLEVMRGDILAKAEIRKFVVIAMLFFLATYQWQQKHIFLKTSLWLVPLLYVAYILHGFPNEYRVFFDINAPLVLLATHTLIVGTGISKCAIYQNQSRAQT